MNDDTIATPAGLIALIDGFRVSQAIHVAARLGIADLLVGGARSSDDLAAATGAHADSLYRLLRALASRGIFRESADRNFELTPAGDLLRSDHPQSLAAWAKFIGGESQWHGWGHLEHTIRTGESGTTKALGMPAWEYRAQHPEATAVFDQAMTSVSRRTAASIVEAYDFGRHERIADIAGGHGALLAAILNRYPGTRGLLFDQAHVVAGTGDLLRAAGVEDRVEVVAGSFFEVIPEADAYILQHILHDWSDEESVQILQAIRAAAPSDARVLIVERVLGPANEQPGPKFSDLNMLVGLGVGRERRAEEYAALIENSGFTFVRVHPAGTHNIVEGAAS